VRTFEEGGNLAGERSHYQLAHAPDPRLVPDTVQAIIAARIDARPEPEKSVLQTAAVIGREFDGALLVRLLGPAGATLPGIMHRLSQAGLVQEQAGASPIARCCRNGGARCTPRWPRTSKSRRRSRRRPASLLITGKRPAT